MTRPTRNPNKNKLTQERLQVLVNYDYKTGEFYKCSPRRGAKQDRLGSINNNSGYLVIGIDGKTYRAHRLAWLYTYGYFPESGIDHIDRNKLNNALDNLREVSHQCNLRNRQMLSTNTSGVTGVIWSKAKDRWQACVTVNKKYKNLGYYKDFTEAVCARLAAEQCLEWPNCNASTPAYLYIKEALND